MEKPLETDREWQEPPHRVVWRALCAWSPQREGRPGWLMQQAAQPVLPYCSDTIRRSEGRESSLRPHRVWGQGSGQDQEKVGRRKGNSLSKCWYDGKEGRREEEREMT